MNQPNSGIVNKIAKILYILVEFVFKHITKHIPKPRKRVNYEYIFQPHPHHILLFTLLFKNQTLKSKDLHNTIKYYVEKTKFYFVN